MELNDRLPVTGPVVRRATRSDVRPLAAILTRAFDDDPLATFVFSGLRRQRLGLHSYFTSQIRRPYLPLGHVHTTEDLGGAAIWGPPELPPPSWRTLVQLLPTAPFLVGRRMAAGLRLLAEVDALHPREPHWYLATLGTEPARQGRGIGSSLLSAGLAEVDESGLPAYLESSKERNVPFYARYGFEVVDVLRVDGAPPLWRMWRPPHGLHRSCAPGW